MKNLLNYPMAAVRVLLMLLNLLFMAFCIFYPIFICKVICHPIKPLRDLFGRGLVKTVEQWTVQNNLIFNLTTNMQWDIEIEGDLNRNESYLALANHQSWMDILAMQYAFSGKTPFPRFFIKQSLIYLPVLGQTWWALDMPFMKRYSKEYLAKHPEKKGQDMETTIRSCQKFKEVPTTLINYLEGTRFTKAKHDKQQSPYKHLLKPKTGGVAFALQAMDGAIKKYIDTTIYFPTGRFTMADLFMNRLGKIVIRISVKDIPQELLKIDYQNNPEDKQAAQQWVTQIWDEKDKLLEQLSQMKD